jgi:GntR family transcriptional regulator/MocR family aminotransferase
MAGGISRPVECERNLKACPPRTAPLVRLVDSDDDLPLHERLYRRLRRLILSGTYPAGSKLPSSRALAAANNISRNSVLTALERLTADGWIQSRKGSGIYVTYRGGQNRRADVVTAKDMSRAALPFAIGTAPVDLFPVKLWRKLEVRTWNHMSDTALGRGDPMGWPDLRAAIAAHVAGARALTCSPDQVIVTTSTRAALDLTIRALNLGGKQVVTEDPSFYSARESLRHSGVTLAPARVDSDGLNIEEAERLYPDARAVLITPACQFPTCVRLSETRRDQLLSWAKRNQGYIFEDDYEWHSDLGRRPPPPLAARDGERTIYFSSFNHVLFSSLRVAFLIVPSALVDVFAAIKAGVDGQSSVPAQVVLSDFMNGGHLDAHFRRLNDAMQERKAALHGELDNGFSDILAPQPLDTGLHVVCDLTAPSEDECAARCSAGGITIALMHHFRSSPISRQQILLGFAQFPPHKLVAASRALLAALR